MFTLEVSGNNKNKCHVDILQRRKLFQNHLKSNTFYHEKIDY